VVDRLFAGISGRRKINVRIKMFLTELLLVIGKGIEGRVKVENVFN